MPRIYFERQSDVFKGMFTCPSGSQVAPEGASDERPIHLEGVKKNDFRTFLRVLIPW